MIALKRRATDQNGVVSKVICGILIILIAGWITYVSVKGTSLDIVIAKISTRVAVLETMASTIKEDIVEIKVLIKEIRNHQEEHK